VFLACLPRISLAVNSQLFQIITTLAATSCDHVPKCASAQDNYSLLLKTYLYDVLFASCWQSQELHCLLTLFTEVNCVLFFVISIVCVFVLIMR